MVCQRCPYRSKFKTASVEPALAFGAQVYSQTPVVLGVLRPHVRMHRQADEACPRAAHKTGAYRNLRFFTLAALVPSAGTLRTLKNLIRLVSGVGTRIPLGMGRGTAATPTYQPRCTMTVRFRLTVSVRGEKFRKLGALLRENRKPRSRFAIHVS
jgi:hypothetical protein